MQTIEMEKMLVVNGETPANAYFMNKLQDNMADAITDVQNSVKDAMKSQETSSDEDTYNCNYINNIMSYSQDEYFTGKRWIDGKKIYGRVYQGTIGTPITHGLNNVDTFMEPHGFYIGASGGSFPLPSTRPNYPEYACGLYVNNSQVTFDKGGSLSALTCYIFLEYTKTTD